MSVLSTRDLLRFRKISSPAISSLGTAFLSLLQSPSGAAVCAAFIPAYTRSEARQESDEATSTDERLRDIFTSSPPTIVIIQGTLTASQVEKAWSNSSIMKEGGPCMADCIFLSHSLHSELQRTKDEGDHEEAANLTIMVLATLASELAHFVYVKVHGYQSSSSPPSPTGSDLQLRTIHSNASVGSFASSVFVSQSVDRMDFGDQAVVRLFGCSFELLSYSIGERQLVKRRVASRRSPSLTPPIIYSLTGQTPRILDVTSHPPLYSSRIPPWKSDSMYAVVSSLTPAGPIPLHGRCTMEDATDWNQDRRGSQFSVVSS